MTLPPLGHNSQRCLLDLVTSDKHKTETRETSASDRVLCTLGKEAGSRTALQHQGSCHLGGGALVDLVLYPQPNTSAHSETQTHPGLAHYSKLEESPRVW